MLAFQVLVFACYLTLPVEQQLSMEVRLAGVRKGGHANICRKLAKRNKSCGTLSSFWLNHSANGERRLVPPIYE